MKGSKDAREEMLNNWVTFEGVMRKLMISDEMTHQEVCICNLISNSSRPVTATDLCEKLSMHKSQMNRTLTRLEDAKIIIRERSDDDRRMMYIKLNKEHLSSYNKLHEKALKIVDALIKKIGVSRTEEMNAMIKRLSNALDDIMSTEETK